MPKTPGNLNFHRFRSLPFLLLAALSILCLGLASCTLFNPSRGLKSCRYDFKSFSFASVDNEKTFWNLDIGVANPNGKPVTIEKMRFTLLRGSDTLVTGWNPARKELASGDSMVIQTSLELPHAILQRMPPGILADTRAEFNLVGDAYLQTWVGEVHVPGALKQTLHVNMPEQVAKVRNIFMQRLFRGFGRSMPKSESPAPSGPVPDAGSGEPL